MNRDAGRISNVSSAIEYMDRADKYLQLAYDCLCNPAISGYHPNLLADLRDKINDMNEDVEALKDAAKYLKVKKKVSKGVWL